ncbi:MAG: putative integral rane protein, partial [Caulobacter sp.]|nr:putative integral rane protein [Caulobacter sp.]
FLLGAGLVALFIWFAENLGTLTAAWIYPSQHDGWKPVSIGKLGAWYLLMLLSFVLVSAVHRPKAAKPGEAA